MRQKGWSDLPPDLLREIAGHLHVAADFVSFHAVCSPWRSSREVLSETTTTQLLPWFLAPTKKHGRSSPLKLRCIFSKSSYRMTPPSYPRRTSWVYSADGATVWYLTFKQLRPTLHDPTTGSVTDLPCFPHYFHYPCDENPRGIVYGDGTTFLYDISGDDRMARFQAAILRPGDANWTLVDRTFQSFAPSNKTFLVSVHALEKVTAPSQVRWVRKEGNCLADRVLFLGSPNSVVVDASLLGGQGGCAYFVYHKSYIRAPPEELGLFRYNFINDTTECIERLPKEWTDDKCTWLVPQPTIPPIQQIIRRKMQAQKLKKQQKIAPVTSPARIFHTERHYQHRFRVLVHNLPLNVKNSQLKLFFSKYGKVSSMEIIYHKNTKTSKGIIKMATMHIREEDAHALLHGLDFYGCRLEVILVTTPRRA